MAHQAGIDGVVGGACVALDPLDAVEALALASGALDHHGGALHAQGHRLGAVGGVDVAFLGPRAHVQQQNGGVVGGGGVVGLGRRATGNRDAEQFEFRRLVDGERHREGVDAGLHADRGGQGHSDRGIEDRQGVVAEIVEQLLEAHPAIAVGIVQLQFEGAADAGVAAHLEDRETHAHPTAHLDADLGTGAGILAAIDEVARLVIEHVEAVGQGHQLTGLDQAGQAGEVVAEDRGPDVWGDRGAHLDVHWWRRVNRPDRLVEIPTG